MTALARGGTLALALLLGAPPAARAGEVKLGMRAGRVEVTSTTSAGWHGDNDDDPTADEDDRYLDLYERLNVAGTYQAWGVALRLDTATFVGESAGGPSDRYTLEKVRVGYAGRDVQVTFGDSYVSFGRGLSLSLRKVDELGTDTTVRGVNVRARTGRFTTTFVAGLVNPQNVDEATGKSLDDPHDLVGGARVEVEVRRGLSVGAHVATFAFHDKLLGLPSEDDTPWADRTVMAGPTLDAPRLLPWLGLYLEGVGQIRERVRYEDDGAGAGVYGALTAYAGPATFLLEGKAYGDLEPVRPRVSDIEFRTIAYNNPPTAERLTQLLDGDEREIAGARLRADYLFSRTLNVFASYGAFHDRVDYVEGEGVIHDPYAGLELRWGGGLSRLVAQGGWRGVLDGSEADPVREDLHGELHVQQALPRGFALDLQGLHLARRKAFDPLIIEEYREGTWQLGARWTNPARTRFLRSLALYGGYEYYDQHGEWKNYANATFAWEMSPSSSIRLFGGSQRGGQKCIAGVCRTFPEFEGVRAMLTLRY